MSPQRSERPRLFRLAPRNPLISEALEGEGWREAEDEATWDLLWSNALPPSRTFKACREGRLVNHFPGIPALTRKDALYWTLEAARLGAASVYRFFPRTHVMPEDREAFLAAAARAPSALWIYKPCADSCGRGVRMLVDPERVPRARGHLVQRYIATPHLLDGFKYTLRCYVAVTSLDPLRVYLFDDGFAKLTSRPFTTSRAHLADRLVHLTNPDVQRLNKEVATSSRNLTHGQYRARLRSSGIDDEALWRQIRRLVAATLIAARDLLLEASGRAFPRPRGSAFELLGFDLLVDRRMKVWLIECNMSPSLSVEADSTTPAAQEERDIKRRVVRGVLGLVGALSPDAGHGFAPVIPSEDTADLL